MWECEWGDRLGKTNSLYRTCHSCLYRIVQHNNDGAHRCGVSVRDVREIGAHHVSKDVELPGTWTPAAMAVVIRVYVCVYVCCTYVGIAATATI